MAAALTAGLGGLSAAVVGALEGERAETRAMLENQNEREKGRCDHAYAVLTDDALNPSLSRPAQEKLVYDDLDVAADCRRSRF